MAGRSTIDAKSALKEAHRQTFSEDAHGSSHWSAAKILNACSGTALQAALQSGIKTTGNFYIDEANKLQAAQTWTSGNCKHLKLH